ncbi:MAG: ABC transporter permease [Candidatus Kariarchaeaceae archaeon]
METPIVEDSEKSVIFEFRTKPPSDNKFLISLITPTLLIFILVILFPIVVGLIISFRNSTGVTGYFGDRFTLTNYFWILFRGDVRTRDFWQYTYQTLFFAIVSLIIEFVLGIVFAKLLNKKFRGRGLARATILIPWALPTIASATIFRYEIFAPSDQFGLINNFLELLSLPPAAFFGPDAEILFKLPILVPYGSGIAELDITATMFTAIAIDVWKTTPFLTLLILAVLQIVPDDLNKAADVAGASGWQKFRYVSWPLIKAGVGVALVFRMMDALRVYDAIVVFRDKEVRSMTWQAANFWLSAQEYGLASAVAIILFLFILAFYFGITKFLKREVESTKKRKIKFSLFRKKKETSLEISPTDLEVKSSPSVFLINESEGRIRELSESKLTWIRVKLKLRKVLFAISIIFMCLFCAAPFIWVVLRSFRDPFITQTQFEYVPLFFSLRAFGVVFETSEFTGVSFGRALFNGFTLSGLTVVVVLIIGSLIAYALAKFDFSGKFWITSFIFTMTSLPPLIIIIPFFIQTATLSDFLISNRSGIIIVTLVISLLLAGAAIVFFIRKKLRKKNLIIGLGAIFIVSLSISLIFMYAPSELFDLRDNIFGLVFPYSAINLPLAVFVLQAFFREIPNDLWRAAKVDGASNFQIFRKIVLPLTVPGIFTCAILVFIASWNELLFAQIWLVNDINHTVPRAILRFVQSPLSLTAEWDTDIALMAATTIATVPLVIVVLIFQKKIISGLTRGAVKG